MKGLPPENKVDYRYRINVDKTGTLKPIDNTVLGVVASHQVVTQVNGDVA